MRQAAPGAGEHPSSLARRRLLKAGLAGALMSSAFGAAAGEASVLIPAMNYVGARLLRQVDPLGMPNFRPDTFGPMTLFVFPVAVAVSPLDIYVADAGLSTLFRYDPSLDAMAPVAGVQVTRETRIAAVQDGSVVVAEGRLGPPKRISRAGRQLQTLNPLNTGSRFDDIVVDTITGRFIGLDRIRRRIEEVQPLGRSSTILPEDLLPMLPSAMALDGQTLYAAGQDCRCVVAIDLLRRDRQVLVEELVQVSAIAAGDGWLVVADNVERILRVYRNGMLRGDPAYESLALLNPQGLSIARGTLYVADAGARRIASFRLRS